jgi:hypothetical protein
VKNAPNDPPLNEELQRLRAARGRLPAALHRAKIVDRYIAPAKLGP